MNKQIILIGGAPTVGKSYIAERLSKELGIPWISTDQVRAMLQAVANKDEYPRLFTRKGYTAEKFLTEFSAEQIAKSEMDEAEDVWVGVNKLINKSYPWKSFIIEGVSILPHLVANMPDKNIKSIFLIDEDADRIREIAHSRGIWNDAKTYPDSVKEKEVEWAVLFSKTIKAEAEKYNLPILEVTKNHTDLEKIISLLDLVPTN